ncbi:MAG: electron transport complex subunit E [Oscillospiraceae bacterium]|nr:electron transport complex subunit E [Oscillospiraceae bacterium]
MNSENEITFKNIVFNGLLKKNPILVSGMVIAPVVVIGNSFMNALALAAAFSVITFFTLIVSSFVPKNIVYTIRIIMYTFIGSLVYVPSAILLSYLIPDGINAMGIFFPLLIANGMIISRSETIFFQESKGHMLLDMIFCILGYDAAVLLYGLIREIIGSGTVCGRIIGMPVVFSGFATPFGGFILLGLMAALLRVVLLTIKRVGKAEAGSPRGHTAV